MVGLRDQPQIERQQADARPALGEMPVLKHDAEGVQRSAAGTPQGKQIPQSTMILLESINNQGLNYEGIA